MDWIITYTLLFFFAAGVGMYALAAVAFVINMALFVIGLFTGSGGGVE